MSIHAITEYCSPRAGLLCMRMDTWQSAHAQVKENMLLPCWPVLCAARASRTVSLHQDVLQYYPFLRVGIPTQQQTTEVQASTMVPQSSRGSHPRHQNRRPLYSGSRTSLLPAVITRWADIANSIYLQHDRVNFQLVGIGNLPSKPFKTRTGPYVGLAICCAESRYESKLHGVWYLVWRTAVTNIIAMFSLSHRPPA